GVATADFSFLPSGGSCLVGEARAQIEQTLKQFSTVKTVKILLNGSEAEALQP
nr:GerMN domain-containing protein [Candidatus Paceibacterota bacterium]